MITKETSNVCAWEKELGCYLEQLILSPDTGEYHCHVKHVNNTDNWAIIFKEAHITALYGLDEQFS